MWVVLKISKISGYSRLVQKNEVMKFHQAASQKYLNNQGFHHHLHCQYPVTI
ncbi:hypothetical protein ACE6H2_001017 [Prunus campanulata]